jgi:WD40 repeat protein
MTFYRIFYTSIFMSLTLVWLGCSQPQTIVKSEYQYQFTQNKVIDGKLTKNGHYTALLDTHNLTLWNNQNRSVVSTWSTPFNAYHAAISNNGERLAIAGKFQVAIFETGSDQPMSQWDVHSFLEHATVTLIQLHDSGDLVLLGMSDGGILFFDLRNKLHSKFAMHAGPVSQLIYQSSAKIWSASTDGSIALWQPSNGKLLKEHQLPHRVMALAVSDTLMFAADNLYTQKIWTHRDNKVLAKLDVERGWLFLKNDLFVDNNSKLLTASTKQHIWLWDSQTGKMLSHWQLKIFSLGSHLLDWGINEQGHLQTINSDGILELWPKTRFVGQH